MADDLKVTIGGDATNLEDAAAKAGKNVSKEFEDIENPFEGMSEPLTTYAGIGGLLFGSIGQSLGQFADEFGGIIGDMLGAVKELADYAQTLRRISIATGLSIGEVRGFEGMAYAFGVSIETMSKIMMDFTEKMGTARIRGGEITNVLAKMGVGLKEIEDGTFDHQKAMKMLAEAYAAGTDEATLLYYGTQLFGEGFKDLLPIIKAGSRAVEDATKTYSKGQNEMISATGRLGQSFDELKRMIGDWGLFLVGAFTMMIEEIQYRWKTVFSGGFWNPFETLEDKVQRYVDNAPKFMSDEEIKERVRKQLSGEDPKKVEEALQKALSGDRGRVLSPFGMAPALASQMQQMGGGDIFGAIAATPLDRIVKATEETARNTTPKPAGEAAPATPTPVAR